MVMGESAHCAIVVMGESAHCAIVVMGEGVCTLCHSGDGGGGLHIVP